MFEEYSHGCNSSAQKEESQEAVYLARGKEKIWSDNTPDDARCVKHLCACTSKMVFLAKFAHVWDVREHPGLDAKLHKSCEDCSYDLTPEHGSWPGQYQRVADVNSAIEAAYGIFM